jgi:mannose-1-phosphate guanylyltransferase
MLSAMVLAAGLGTRLKPLTDQRAKALVPVGDRPILGHVLDQLRAAGTTRIVVNTHYRARDVEAYAAAQRDEVLLSSEPELLGTAGGLAKASPLLGAGSVIVWNADILADVEVGALVAAHARDVGGGDPAVGTLLVRPLASGQGNIGWAADGRVVRLRRESVGEEAFGGEFLGIHVVDESLRRVLPARGCLVGDVYIPALRRGARLGALVHEGAFFDVGTLHGYLAANRAWLAAREASSWTATSAQVAAGVALEESIVGEEAIVGGKGRFERCVVWPGAVATAPLSDAIVTLSGVVAVDDAAVR